MHRRPVGVGYGGDDNAGELGCAVLLGYDPSVGPTRKQITTGSGVEFAPEISIDRIEALGMERLRFPVLCHTLPPSAGVDGLLGLDFLRGQRVVLDFRAGTITVD